MFARGRMRIEAQGEEGRKNAHTQSQELDVTTLEAALELILAMCEVVFGIGGQDSAQLRLHGGGAFIFALEVLHVARGEEVEDGEGAGVGEESITLTGRRLASD